MGRPRHVAERVTLKPGLRLYGGFQGTETDLAQRNRAAHVTTVFHPNGPVVTVTHADRMTRFDGIGRPLDGNADGNTRGDMGAFALVHPTADSNGDGQNDADGVVAGTDPAEAMSVMKLMARLNDTRTALVLSWPIAVGRLSQVETRTPIVSINAWQTLTNDLPENGSVAE